MFIRQTLMLFRFLILVHVCAAFPLKCPEPAQWSLRARSHCSDPSKYFCLKNDLINGYSENCTVFDFLQPGRKNVLRGGLDADVCSSERFQPWPIKFFTNVSTNCIFLKSKCDEEGQVLHGNGNRNIDKSCRCDYTRGYDILIKPLNPCFCVPSIEDCSCYHKTCPKTTDRLSPDYECFREDKNLTVSACEAIIYKRTNTTRDYNTKKYISRSEKWSHEVLNDIILTAICIGFICFFGMGVIIDELLDRYYREVYFIYEPLNDIELVEGQPMILKYKLSTSRFPVSFLKNNQFMAETRNIEKSVVGRSKEIKFTNVTLSDAGTYCLKVKDRKSSLIEMIIHPMFTSNIDPQICIEGDKLKMVCSVYDDNIEVQWYKENQKLKDCENMVIKSNKNQRVLTIEKTTIKDSGKYYVKAGNVEMEIPVTVKDILRRPLVNVTIMEGLDAKFECETEQENVPVEWFYNKKDITESTERRQIHSSQGRVHTLTILQTIREDSGQYSITINDFHYIVKLNVTEMPVNIKRMSVYNRNAFLKASKSGTTKRCNIRVMIVGKQKAGKTCLLRRLMNEEIGDVKSTDGINIERRKCHIDIQTGEWHFSTLGQKPRGFSTDQSEEFADCGFWDFAGQKEFYATHQTFLSANAVYLLVVDISKDFKSKTYENMIEKEFDSIGEYIDFWLDNIHCYCTDDRKSSMQCDETEDLKPPVIIVGTWIDQIPLNEREERKRNFLKQLSDTMSTQPKRGHFRKPHFLSNTNPSDNKQEFEELRKDILCKAKALSNWEEHLPLRWVILEKEIYRKKTETTSLYTEDNGGANDCEKDNVISYHDVKCLAMECSFPDVQQNTSELDSFLKYEHEIGNIIFFKDVEEYIVLDPEWLADVFSCFVSHDYNDESLNMKEWAVLDETGRLEDKLIETLLKKVPNIQHKQYLLKLMVEFGIIVKPKNEDYRNDIYMPCMIKPRQFQDSFGKVDLETENCKKSSWFCLQFNFLPPSYFNHILVSFVQNKQLVYDKTDRKLGIFRNIGIFQLNTTGSERLVLCLSKNLIAMQVKQMDCYKNEHHCYSYIKKQLIGLVNSIKLRYRINVTYEIRFKCPDGSLHDDEGIGYDEAMEISKYLCTYHDEMHSSKDIYRYWLEEEEVEEEHKNKGRKKCNNCESMSVYRCYNCNIILCKDCSRKHELKYSNHEMQCISDRFILNFRFRCDSVGPWINAIKCLPNGLLAVVLSNKKLITYAVIGKQGHNIPLKEGSHRIAVVDKNTVALLLHHNTLNVAIVDIQQTHVQYIQNTNCPMDSSFPLIYIENKLYFAYKLCINVVDMSGAVHRRIELSFTPYDMCYDVDSQRIYCIDRDNSKLVCIDRNGTFIFTFTDPNWKNLKRLTIDNGGNVLVMCIQRNNNLRCVIKVDVNGKSSDVVITNIQLSRFFLDEPCICFHHLTNSIVIGVCDTVYIYKGTHRVDI